jgi:hypothetical protein
MIFSLAIQPIILSLDSQLNIWYLDDGTLADYPEVVLSDFKKVINLSKNIGLELNCEIFCCSGDTDLKVIKKKRSSRTVFSKNVIENTLFRPFQTQVNAKVCVLDGKGWRYLVTHCCQIVSSMIAKSHDTNYNRKFSSRNEMTKIFAGFPTNKTLRLKKFVVWTVNDKKLTLC